MKTDSRMIIVQVAPGCYITVPHPSGIRELPPKTLSGGATLTVPAETADALFAARLINNPANGQPPEPPPAKPPVAPTGVTIR